MNNYELFEEFASNGEFFKAAAFALDCANGCGSARRHAEWCDTAVYAATQISPEMGETIQSALGGGRWGNIAAAKAALKA